MNCSGKHAAMLLTCVVNGWDTATYRAPDHPLQQAIAATFAELTGEPVAVTRRRRLRRAAALHLADRAGPRLPGAGVGHRRRRSTGSPRRSARTRSTSPAPRATSCTLLTAIPGAIGKAGAEACYAVALAGRPGVRAQDRRRRRPGPAGGDGRGAARGGVTAEAGVDAAALDDTGRVPVLGGGEPVGEIRAAF